MWQNLLISDVADRDVGICIAAINALGLGVEASAIRRGLVACTGNAGCKFAASNTKGHALKLADYLEARVAVDTPINIHLTGCHHSCAQHYVGDIGLLAAKVDRGEDSVEGYHVYIGGGAASTAEQAMARDYAQSVAFDDLPPLLERLLAAYLAHRAGADRIVLRILPPARDRRRCASWPTRRRSGRWRHERRCTPLPSLIPENAPFSTEQRAWLNGFFAAYLGVSGETAGEDDAEAAEPTRTSPGTTRRSRCRNGWSSPRTRKPERQLMAAMAQLDCGQCGYLCQTYAEAVWSGAEADMGRCVPGGKETQRKLKELIAALERERDGTPSAAPVVKPAGVRRLLARPARACHAGRCPSAQPPGLRARTCAMSCSICRPPTSPTRPATAWASSPARTRSSSRRCSIASAPPARRWWPSTARRCRCARCC